jgi:hypothetical protein
MAVNIIGFSPGAQVYEVTMKNFWLAIFIEREDKLVCSTLINISSSLINNSKAVSLPIQLIGQMEGFTQKY